MSYKFINILLKKIEKNKKKNPKVSYTAKLIRSGMRGCKKKFLEEVNEFVFSLNQNKKSIQHEAADLLYHFFVLLKLKKINFISIIQELKKRSKISGIQEKNNRLVKKNN